MVSDGTLAGVQPREWGEMQFGAAGLFLKVERDLAHRTRREGESLLIFERALHSVDVGDVKVQFYGTPRRNRDNNRCSHRDPISRVPNDYRCGLGGRSEGAALVVRLEVSGKLFSIRSAYSDFIDIVRTERTWIDYKAKIGHRV